MESDTRTPLAIEHLIEFVKSLNTANFAITTTTTWLTTSYKDTNLRIRNRGFSASTMQQSLHFQVSLGTHGQAGIDAYSVWIYSPDVQNPAANRAAVIACLEELKKGKRWSTESSISGSP